MNAQSHTTKFQSYLKGATSDLIERDGHRILVTRYVSPYTKQRILTEKIAW